MDAVAEARAILVAGVGEGLVEANVLACALRQHVHLLAAIRPRQLIAVVLDAGMPISYYITFYVIENFNPSSSLNPKATISS